MKNISTLIVIVFLLQACASTKNIHADVLPSEVEAKVKFDMPLDDFKKLKGTSASETEANNFRTIYTERVSEERVSGFAYYFSTEGEKPLYEIIIIYKDENERDIDAERLFGEPNVDGEEWFIERKPHDLKAWKYGDKLIITALIPGTEWYKDAYD
jgi:hypothetical protein